MVRDTPTPEDLRMKKRDASIALLKSSLNVLGNFPVPGLPAAASALTLVIETFEVLT